MELKRATSEDVDRYLALEGSVADTKLYSVITDKDEALKELEEAVVYFIMEGEEVIGHIAYQMKSNDHAYLSSLVIIPTYQGKGLAREALGKVLEELEDIKTIDLVTHPDNVKAIKLYESFGFTVGEKYENYFGDGEPRVRLVLTR